MTRRSGPAMVLASGLIVAQAVAVLTSDSAWMLGVGALLFALALVGSDAWVSRLRAESSRPSREGLFLALVFLAACGLGSFGDPQLLTEVMAILAGGAAFPVLRRTNHGRNVRAT